MKAYAIKYTGGTPSYFSGWVDGAYCTVGAGKTGLPAFGATRAKAVRYATRAEAQAQIDSMPFQAAVMCAVVGVRP